MADVPHLDEGQAGLGFGYRYTGYHSAFCAGLQRQGIWWAGLADIFAARAGEKHRRRGGRTAESAALPRHPDRTEFALAIRAVAARGRMAVHTVAGMGAF